MHDQIDALTSLANTSDRQELWGEIIKAWNATSVLELGVWKGEFAESILTRCPSINRYYMLDSWRPLANWNKPLNVDGGEFEAVYREAMARTTFASDRRVLLRGTTTEVIDTINDEELDVAYIDGDHTLRGISIDLIRTYPKIRPGGLVGGDDYTRSIWQHPTSFEPTLVCPFAAYFAEAVQAPMVVFPGNQFAILKPTPGKQGFRVIDTTGAYGDLNLLSQITRPN